MAKRKKKKKKTNSSITPGPPTIMHHLISAKDIPHWGAGTLCGERVRGGTEDHTRVTCERCKRGTNWDVDTYRRACEDPVRII